MDTCICIIESPCCTPETNNIVDQLYLKKLKLKLNLKKQKRQKKSGRQKQRKKQ